MDEVGKAIVSVPTNPIVIRRWTPGDAPSAEDLKDLNVLLGELRAPDDPEPNLTCEDFVEHMRFTNTVLIISRDSEAKRIVGMTSLHAKHLMGIGLIGEVEEVVLKKEYRGCGIAEALEDELFCAARERGIKFLSLTSSPWRIAANKFYERRGWTHYTTNNYWLTLE